MAEVTFYHQQRADGGRRSGLTVDGTTVLHGFIPGEGEYDPALEWEYDPALEWYVDVTLVTATPPTQVNALLWLQGRAAEIRQALAEAARLLSIGIDATSMPAELELPGAEGPVRVTLSAARRQVGRAVGEKLRWLAGTDWAPMFPGFAAQG